MMLKNLCSKVLKGNGGRPELQHHKIILPLFLFLLVILISSNASALNCNYDPQPYMSKIIDLMCYTKTTNKSYSCLVYVYDNESELLQINPSPYDLEGVGRLDKFVSTRGLVSAYYTKKDLRPQYNYTVLVECAVTDIDGNRFERWNATVMPSYYDLRIIPYRTQWLTQNWGYVIGILIFLFVTALLIRLIFLSRRD